MVKTGAQINEAANRKIIEKLAKLKIGSLKKLIKL
jgi:hypothetical protein